MGKWFAQVAGGGGGLPPDGDYGDILVTVGGTVWSIDPAYTAAVLALAAAAAPRVVEATLDFGAEGDTASVTVAAAWATGTSKIVVSITDDARIEDALIEQITVGVAARGAGTFDIWGAAPNGTNGQYKVHAVGL